MPYTNSPLSLSSIHTHLVQPVTTASHPPLAFILSPRYANSLTVSTSSQTFHSAPLPLQYSLQSLCRQNFLVFSVTMFTLVYLPWIYLPHCLHKTKLAFALKLQTPQGSTLPLDKPSVVMLSLTITLAYPRIIFKSFLSNAYHKNFIPAFLDRLTHQD